MSKTRIFTFFILCSASVMAQTAISGTVGLEEGDWGQKVYLGRISLEADTESVREVAWSPISEEGAFSFKTKHISDKDAIYRLYVEKVEKIIEDTITTKKDFIISNKDEILFPRGFTSKYKNTNKADSEWLKFKEFQQKNDGELHVDDTISEAYAIRLKAYTKDSLKILVVKLIGVQQLAKKGLLDSDITKNPAYYLNFLAELKESDMHPSEYRFLTKRLAYLTQDLVEQKYQWSKMINVLFLITIGGLSFLVYRSRKKQTHVPTDLSKQEKNIQTLILEGKSNKEIANALFISISTVKTHITNIYSKLHVTNRQELMRKTQIRRGTST